MARKNGKEVYMPDYIKEQSDLAHIYAEDGAYQSAARILRNLATMVQAHADSVEKMFIGAEE